MLRPLSHLLAAVEKVPAISRPLSSATTHSTDSHGNLVVVTRYYDERGELNRVETSTYLAHTLPPSVACVQPGFTASIDLGLLEPIEAEESDDSVSQSPSRVFGQLFIAEARPIKAFPRVYTSSDNLDLAS